jgi:hypothetical protein
MLTSAWQYNDGGRDDLALPGLLPLRNVSPAEFRRHGTVLDSWRLLDKDALGAVVEYLVLGFGASLA